MATFGYETIGSSTSTVTGHIDGSQYTMGSVAGKGVNIIVALRYSGSFSGNVKCAIYLASDLSAPITNGVTEERNLTLTSSFVWYTFNFPTSPDLNPDTDYCLYCWADAAGGTAQMARDADASVNRWYETWAYDSFPSLSASDRTGKFSIYCTYTPSGAAAKGLINKLNRRTMLPQISVTPFKKRFPHFNPKTVI